MGAVVNFINYTYIITTAIKQTNTCIINNNNDNNNIYNN